MSNSKFGLRTRKGIIRPFVEGAQAILFDADALAYITANTAITSTADKNAINTFFLGLKSDGIYTKMKAMYLPIWGTPANCKWNLVNNRSFDLTFTTGWIFTSGGMTPNGSSDYADTNLIPSSALTLDSTHLSIYSRTDGAGGSGCWDSGINGIIIYSDTIEFAIRVNDSTFTSKTPIGNTSKGLFIANRISSTTKKLIQNTNISNYSINSTVLSNIKLYLSAINANGTTIAYDNKQCAFSSIGDGLTDAEATNLSNRVNTLMTYFGINVYNTWNDSSTWNDSNNWTE